MYKCLLFTLVSNFSKGCYFLNCPNFSEQNISLIQANTLGRHLVAKCVKSRCSKSCLRVSFDNKAKQTSNTERQSPVKEIGSSITVQLSCARLVFNISLRICFGNKPKYDAILKLCKQ